MIPKPGGDVLTGAIVRLGYAMVDETKMKAWMRSGMFEQTLCKVVMSHLLECINGML